MTSDTNTGVLSLGCRVLWHTQILADQLTLFQPEGTDYAHLITTGTPKFSVLPTQNWLELQLLPKSEQYVELQFLNDQIDQSKKNSKFLYNFVVIYIYSAFS